MRKPVVAYVFDHAARTPDKWAVLTPSDRITYAQLAAEVRGYSAFLRASGVKKGDVVVVRAAQTIEYAVIYLAIHLSGGVVTSLEHTISDEAMLQIARQVSAGVILYDHAPRPNEYPALYIPRADVRLRAAQYAAQAEAPAFPGLADSADILFTTGTTGASKGVELSHNALTATAENLIFGCGYRPDTMIIVPGPLNHANAIRKLFTTFVNGSTIYLLNGMTNLKAFFAALETPEGTVACCLPPAAIRTIFALTHDRIARYRIDFIESATSPLPETDKQRLCELLPDTRLYNNYGSSEAASVCIYDYNHTPGKAGCVGRPMPNARILIVDDDHRVIDSSPDRMGLIACQGDVNMKGYVNDPAQTAEVLQNGVVYTSDVGFIDSEGYVYVSGRKGDVINVGGLKVAPTEVESAVLGFEGVADCICIPVKDPISGQALQLLVVMEDGRTLDEKALRAYLSRTLEIHKVPRFYRQVDHVERTYNGKLNRKAYLPST